MTADVSSKVELRTAAEFTDKTSNSSTHAIVAVVCPPKSRMEVLLEAALQEPEDVLLAPLCEIFSTICGFMSNWGRIFMVAANDLQSKVGRVRKAINYDGVNYRSMASAATFEKKKGLFLEKHPDGITNALFSLHRTMRFVVVFIDGIRKSHPSIEMSMIAKDAYHNSVAPHHNWAVRRMTLAAMAYVPARRELIESILRMDGNKVDEATFFQGFGRHADKVRDRMGAILGKE